MYIDVYLMKAWEPAGVQVVSNLFSSLVDEEECVGSEPNVGRKLVKAGVRFARKLATWNSAGLCSEREISEVDIVAGQDRVVNVDGYKWFGKPRIDQNNLRGEVFLVRECIVEEVEFIRDVGYEECLDEGTSLES